MARVLNLIAAFAFVLVSFGALAQTAPTDEPPPNVPAPPANGPKAGGGVLAGTKASPRLFTGWNPFVCYASESYVFGGNTYIYAFNRDGSYFYWFTNGAQVGTQSELQFACHHGRYQLHITSLSPVSYDAVYVPHP